MDVDENYERWVELCNEEEMQSWWCNQPFRHFNFRQWKKDTIWIWETLRKIGHPTYYKTRKQLDDMIEEVRSNRPTIY